MTISPDDQHHNDAIIQVEPEQYRGLDARSYTACRLVPAKALDFCRSIFANSSMTSIMHLHITYT